MNESICTKMNAKNKGNIKSEDDKNKRQDKIHKMWTQKFHMDVNCILYKLITHANMTIKRLYFSPTKVQGKQCNRVSCNHCRAVLKIEVKTVLVCELVVLTLQMVGYHHLWFLDWNPPLENLPFEITPYF
jgi:hypothetical protein